MSNRLGFRVAAQAVTLCLATSVLSAQQDRIFGPIDTARRAPLRGALQRRALPQFDRGAAGASFRVPYITLFFKPADQQRLALEQLLADQQDPSSPMYHRWLTGDQFADRFGLSPGDTDKIVGWLKSEGFVVDYVAGSRLWVAFTGSAEQLQNTFGADIHRYTVDGEMHFANAREPLLPAALAEVVGGFHGLDDFHPKAPHRDPIQPITLYPSPGGARPYYTTPSGMQTLAPPDIATIYDVKGFYDNGFHGVGQSIVIVGQTRIDDLGPIEGFRSMFNLSSNDPQMVLVPNSPDPGVVDRPLSEAYLDLEWAGAVAREATLIYVYADDVYVAAQYAIEQNLAPVVSMSYGDCERAKAGLLDSYRLIAQQAAARGITWVVASGDSGGASCDPDPQALTAPASASGGLAVAFPASVPEVTAVGGTRFNEDNGSYWDSSGSAVKYIPERVWNDSALRKDLSAGGGGVSSYFPTPSWQTGVGFPNDGHRDVPDVAMAASSDHDGYFLVTSPCIWLIGCSFSITGGTSASAPVFAGIVALLNEYLVAKRVYPQTSTGLGNINPVLYRLAQDSSTHAFHDVTVGDNKVPCTAGTPDCTSGSLGYAAQIGYDQATGLGSVDAYNLALEWARLQPPIRMPSNVQITFAPSTINQSADGKWYYNVTLQEINGVGVTLTKLTWDGIDYTSSIGGWFGSTYLPAWGQLTGSFYATCTCTAPWDGTWRFQGNDDSGNAGLAWAGVAHYLSATATNTGNMQITFDPAAVTQDFDGNWYYSATLQEVNGVGITFTRLLWNGIDYSSSIATWFGSAYLPAWGSLSGNFYASCSSCSTAWDGTWQLIGNDSTGHVGLTWTGVVHYLPLPTANLQITITPTSVKQSSDGKWYYSVTLDETNGIGIAFTNLTWDGIDYTSSITNWFGSSYLPAFGELSGSFVASCNCSPPWDAVWQFSGIDDNGHTGLTWSATTHFVSSSGSPSGASKPATGQAQRMSGVRKGR